MRRHLRELRADLRRAEQFQGLLVYAISLKEELSLKGQRGFIPIEQYPQGQVPWSSEVGRIGEVRYRTYSRKSETTCGIDD